MTTPSIVESGMTFGPFPEGRCFHIEESRVYKAIQENVRIAEFLLLHKASAGAPVLWVIEAKSSSPKPGTPQEQKFDDFIAAIRDKLVNAFSLGWASCLGRHPHADAELPEGFRSLDLAKVNVKFVLIIKGHQTSWLPPLQEALGKALGATVKTWSFSPTSVVVINDVGARRYGLIFAEG